MEKLRSKFKQRISYKGMHKKAEHELLQDLELPPRHIFVPSPRHSLSLFFPCTFSWGKLCPNKHYMHAFHQLIKPFSNRTCRQTIATPNPSAGLLEEIDHDTSTCILRKPSFSFADDGGELVVGISKKTKCSVPAATCIIIFGNKTGTEALV